MRIALCLSGQPRTWRHTVDGLFRFFAGHEVEVFFHTWDEVDPQELDALIEAYSPKRRCVEARPLFVESKREMAARFPASPPLAVFDMFHSVAASLRLAADDEGPAPFDLICRTRFDLAYDGQWEGAAPPDGAILAPTSGGDLLAGVNDQFALGAPAAMRAYAGMAAWLPTGLAELAGPSLRPELALGHYLTEVRGLNVVQAPLPVALLRPDFVGKSFAELRDDPMFHARKREEWQSFAAAHFDPSLVQALNFDHYGRTPLALDRWLAGLPEDVRQAVLRRDWPVRVAAIDGLVGHEVRQRPMGAEVHGLTRLICAAVVHRMARGEAMGAEAFIVHALSANVLDMRRAQQWMQADPGRLALVQAALPHAPTLAAALAFAPAFEQPASAGWRLD